MITLAGAMGISRMGASVLSAVGLPEMIAHDANEFVRIATNLAGDLPRISALRATMRERLFKSPLTDARRFTRDLEGAFRRAWRGWWQKGVASNQ